MEWYHFLLFASMVEHGCEDTSFFTSCHLRDGDVHLKGVITQATQLGAVH